MAIKHHLFAAYEKYAALNPFLGQEYEIFCAHILPLPDSVMSVKLELMKCVESATVAFYL